MTTQATSDQVRAGLSVLMVVAETIRELREVPSGELYAHLMGHLDLDQYTKVLGILKRAGLVQERGHLLTWSGPLS